MPDKIVWIIITLQHNYSESEGVFDFIIVIVAVVIVLISIILCIKLLIKPGEKEKSHIKRTILEDDKSPRIK